jgi:hypothetical protein
MRSKPSKSFRLSRVAEDVQIARRQIDTKWRCSGQMRVEFRKCPHYPYSAECLAIVGPFHAGGSRVRRLLRQSAVWRSRVAFGLGIKRQIFTTSLSTDPVQSAFRARCAGFSALPKSAATRDPIWCPSEKPYGQSSVHCSNLSSVIGRPCTACQWRDRLH